MCPLLYVEYYVMCVSRSSLIARQQSQQYNLTIKHALMRGPTYPGYSSAKCAAAAAARLPSQRASLHEPPVWVDADSHALSVR